MDLFRRSKGILSALAVIALTMWSPNIGSAAASCPIAINPAVQEQIRTNNYEKNRDLNDYANNLTYSAAVFLDILAGLPEGSIVVDMGAGTARALTQMLEYYPKIGLGVAISHTRPQPYNEPTHLDSRFTYIDGDYVENMMNQGKLDHLKGRVKLMTDFLGPISYSGDLVPLLQAYVDLLMVGGHAYIHFSEKKTIIKKGNQEISLIDWLKTIPGIFVKRGSSAGMGHGHFYIRKDSDKVIIPNKLILKKHQPASGLPVRFYELK